MTVFVVGVECTVSKNSLNKDARHFSLSHGHIDVCVCGWVYQFARRHLGFFFFNLVIMKKAITNIHLQNFM